MNERTGGVYGREVPLSASYLATLRSPDPSPEELLIAAEEGECVEEADPFGPRQARRLQLVLSKFLSVEESHLLQAYYGLGQSQAALAEHLGIYENSLQYRLGRAVERVRWAMQLETWNRSRRTMRLALASVVGPSDLRFAVALWHNRWNQSRTAEWIGSTQSRVRVRTLRLLDALKASTDRRVMPYARDLERVVTQRAWSVSAPQVQDGRTIKLANYQTTGVQLAFQFRRKAA